MIAFLRRWRDRRRREADYERLAAAIEADLIDWARLDNDEEDR